MLMSNGTQGTNKDAKGFYKRLGEQQAILIVANLNHNKQINNQDEIKSM